MSDIHADLAAPHADLLATVQWADNVFRGDEEKPVLEALRKTWNRVLARNMVYTEGTTQHIVKKIQQATNFVQQGNCEMAQQTIDNLPDRPDGSVSDGLVP